MKKKKKQNKNWTKSSKVIYQTIFLKISIYFSHLIDNEGEFMTNWVEVVESFDDMGLKAEVLRGIYGHGFVKPSPI